MKFCLLCLVVALLTISGCSRKPAPLTAEDLRIARQAMPLTEVSLMVRSHSNQQAIITEVVRRHIPAKPDAHTEEALLKFGASVALMQALKDDANVLTETQKQAYDSIAAERDAKIRQGREARQEEAAAQEQEEVANRQRKQRLNQQSVQLAQNRKSSEEVYWEADKAYRAKKKSLESRIVSQQAYINRLRSNGYNESDLTRANQNLDGYKDELSHLVEPIR